MLLDEYLQVRRKFEESLEAMMDAKATMVRQYFAEKAPHISYKLIHDSAVDPLKLEVEFETEEDSGLEIREDLLELSKALNPPVQIKSFGVTHGV